MNAINEQIVFFYKTH